jgi:hypothetical protein
MEGVEVEVAGGTEQEAVSVAMSIALTLISGCSTGLGGVIAAFFGISTSSCVCVSCRADDFVVMLTT